MCDPEAFAAIAEWINLGHSYGEATWNNMQWWISGSFAVILTAYFARETLNPAVATLLGILHASFTAVVLSNAALDGAKILAVDIDVNQFASVNGCDALAHLQPLDLSLDVAQTLFPFIILMWASTIGYLAYSCWLNVKSKKN